MNISTARLTIRPLALKDLADFHCYRSNPEVTKYQGFDVFTLQQAKQFIEENATKQFGKPGEWVQYGIENTDTGYLIGDCALRLDQYDSRVAEIGITISHLEQQKGYAKEVIGGVLTFLFDVQQIHRVVVIVDAENTAAIHLFTSLAFRLEGHFVENVFFKGKWGSEFQFAMLQREWDSRA